MFDFGIYVTKIMQNIRADISLGYRKN